jgi:hypothetical protein
MTIHNALPFHYEPDRELQQQQHSTKPIDIDPDVAAHLLQCNEARYYAADDVAVFTGLRGEKVCQQATEMIAQVLGGEVPGSYLSDTGILFFLASPSPSEEQHYADGRVATANVTTKKQLVIEEAFGNNKLWHDPLRGGPPGGVSSVGGARKRIQFPLPKTDQPLSPKEKLLHWGFVENHLRTKTLFHAGAERGGVSGNPTASFACKRIRLVGITKSVVNGTNGIRDGLDASTPSRTSSQGCEVRYFPRANNFKSAKNQHDAPGEEEQNERKICRVEADIADWFSKVPEGYMRFLHGTNGAAALSVMSDGIQERYFERESDFGPAFYCVEDMHMAMLYVVVVCAAVPAPTVRGAIMAFDIPQDTFTTLERLCVNVNAPEWEWHPFVSHCQGNDAKAAFTNQSSQLASSHWRHLAQPR